ncbi:hypothetical protein TWF730_001479 [Orbilia blumenaviensis]|uniref:lipoyl(octanoyl) transferase n=1 Tax=Orbilia blumenaviensis TaxID=1796055 RepID=A0AAV9UJT3_9PEZI
MPPAPLPPLRVLKLPLTSYSHASRLQSILFNLHLLYKSSLSNNNNNNTKPAIPQPPPYLITTSFRPVYTFGRREASKPPPKPLLNLLSQKRASIAYTPRGGQVTFHGPGQIVTYPILDLKRHNLSPRCYIRVLENSVIATLKEVGVEGFTTEEAGVWVRGDRKVASVGVNLRRWVCSHGVAVNVDTDLEWFGRIVACGLEGVEMWSVRRELEEKLKRLEEGGGRDDGDLGLVEMLGEVPEEGFRGKIEDGIISQIASGIGCQETEEITEEEVEDLGREYGLSGEDGVEWLKFSDETGGYYRVKGDKIDLEDHHRSSQGSGGG